jgi:hypothetical protein
MSPEFSEFISANGTAVVIVLGVLAAIGLVQWRKVRIEEAEQEYKQKLLDRGVPLAEVERTVEAKPPPTRRGLIEQFGALSGGAKTGIIIGVTLFGIVTVSCIAGALSSRAHYAYVRDQQNAAYRSDPPLVDRFDAIPGHAFYLDLQPVANQRLTDTIGDNGHSFAELPQKRRDFGGVPFQVGPGFVRLKGKNRPELPAEVNDVHVGFKFDKLHILHGTEFGAFGGPEHHYHVPEGTEIGRYRVRYTDGEERMVPVVYGKDVRDSWNWDKSRATSRGKVVWTGSSPGAKKEGVSLRLYLTSWENPRPGEEVECIDFVSECTTAASPFCIALTAERATK